MNKSELGLFSKENVGKFSKFNIDSLDSMDSTSPVWSKVAKTALAVGAAAAEFI